MCISPGGSGSPWILNQECVSGLCCNGGACGPCGVAGGFCTYSSECQSNLCLSGRCATSTDPMAPICAYIQTGKVPQ